MKMQKFNGNTILHAITPNNLQYWGKHFKDSVWIFTMKVTKCWRRKSSRLKLMKRQLLFMNWKNQYSTDAMSAELSKAV